MNKILYCLMLSAVMYGYTFQAHAAFVLTGTRFIYEEGQNSISVLVNNESESQYGGQVWIENVEQSNDDVFLIPAPSFFRIEPEQQQIIRVLKVNDALPKDRETLFWLNVMELPPKQDQSNNHVAFAMNTKVKLIYRPSALKQSRQGAETALIVTEKGGKQFLENPTPYFFAVTSLRMNGQVVQVSDQVRRQIGTFKPYTAVDITELALPVQGRLSINALNDWGGADEYVLREQ